MATLAQVKTALAQTIAAYGSITTEAYIYDNIEEFVHTPAIIIDVSPDSSADFEESFGGAHEIWKMDIYVLVSRSKGSGAGAKELDQYLTREGPKSIRNAIYLNSSLGLEDTDATAHGISGYGGRFEFGSVDHVGAIIRVRVHTDGRED